MSEPIQPRACAKLGVESVIEIRDIAKPGIQSKVNDANRFHQQPRCGMPQSRTHYIVVRSDIGELAEYSQKVIPTQLRLLRQPVEFVPRTRATLDHAHDPSDSRLGGERSPV
jgi:hypothetical protein